MSRAYDFMKECRAFFVLTMADGFPAGRPFGAIMELGEDLYISTGNTKAVYRQLKQNGNMQLLAMKEGTRSWIRVTGVAEECCDLSVKETMMERCPVLQKHYTSASDPKLAVFRIHVANTEISE